MLVFIKWQVHVTLIKLLWTIVHTPDGRVPDFGRTEQMFVLHQGSKKSWTNCNFLCEIHLWTSGWECKNERFLHFKRWNHIWKLLRRPISLWRKLIAEYFRKLRWKWFNTYVLIMPKRWMEMDPAPDAVLTPCLSETSRESRSHSKSVSLLSTFGDEFWRRWSRSCSYNWWFNYENIGFDLQWDFNNHSWITL